MIRGTLIALFLLFVATSVFAGDCKKTGSVCLDSTPCKTVSGQQVCLATFGLSCWEHEDTYTCIKPDAINYCQPLVNAGCWQTSSVCAQTDTLLNTGCMRHTQTYRCGNPSQPTPSNTIRLDSAYTLVSSAYNSAACASQDGNQNCALAESVCTSTTPPALPPGITPAQVAPDGCYQRANTYACLTGRSDSSQCDGYASNPNCTLQTTSQCDPDDVLRGQCTYQERNYRCMSVPPRTSTVTDCSGNQFCQGGNCFDQGYESDTDFGKAMGMMEAARQAGSYMDPNSLLIFSGVSSQCKIKLFGLANCCKKSGGGGGMSNSAVMGAAMSAGGQALQYGSRYVYDSLLGQGFLAEGLNAMSGGVYAGALESFGSSADAFIFQNAGVSLYGFTISASTPTALLGTATQVGSAPIIGNLNLYFNPYMFAIAVAIMVIQDMMSCEPDEKMLDMRRSQNLCVHTGTRCTSKIPIIKTCIEHTQTHCCFNSRLARIINEQGRAQIGKGWSSCDGFSQSEFASLDFSRIDLAEFVAEIMANVNLSNAPGNSTGVANNAQAVVQQKMQNYYQRGSQ